MSEQQQHQTSDILARLRGKRALGAPPLDLLHDEAADEIERLRALVTRLTNVAENLAGELSDPGTEALAAIYCGRNFIYG